MKNYIYKIARDNLKKNNSYYKHIFLSMFFTFFIIIFSCILFNSLEKFDYEKRAYTNGKWDVIVEDINEENEKIINDLKYASKKGELFIGGEVIFNNQNIGYIGYYDEVGYELANLHLLKGRFAKTDNEVVVEESILMSMNLELGQEVELNYEANDQVNSKIYKVVGVIEDYVYYWDSLGLSFITKEIESYDKNVMLKASIPILLLNEVNNSIAGATLNTFNYPHYQLVNGTYLNESPLLSYALEIIIFSFIAILSSIMSSLDKRESQLVLFRSIGMTYKQLKKLIAYEGYILAFLAFILAVIVSVLSSVVVMWLYALISGSVFIWYVSLTALCIELSISIFIMIIGIKLPTLTVYQLPLTSKRGEYYYHPKNRKIRKPTLKSIALYKLFNNKVHSSFIFIILCFILFRGFMMIDKTMNYHSNLNNSNNYNYDYSWSGYNLDIDISPLLNNKDIHIIESKCMDGIYLKWDDMDKEVSTILFRRGDYVQGRIACIESDYEVINYLKDKGYNMSDLDNNEAIVIIPNHNYAISSRDSYTLHEYEVDIVRKKDGMYAEDLGLKEDNNIYVYDPIEDEAYNSLRIEKVIYLEEQVIRESFHYYTVIVNENTYKDLTTYDFNNYYVIKADNDIARSKVQKFFHSVTLSQGHWVINLLTDIRLDQIEERDILKTEYFNDMIHDFMMNLVFIFLIYVMSILSVDKEKKIIHLYRNVGMTKKDIYIINFIYSSAIYIFSLVGVLIGWILWYKVAFDGFVNIIGYLEKQIIVYVMMYGLTFIVYTICMLIPIKNILKEKSLNYMK